MGKKIDALVEQAKQEMQEGIDNRLINNQEEKARIRASEMFGALRAMDSLRKSLSSQVIRGLKQFQEEKGHEAYGFARFDDFLDGYEHSPMSKHQFYDHVKQLDREGDELYDTLNALKIPMSARKLLTDGSLQVDGDEIIIGGVRASLEDRAFIKQTIKTIAQETAKQSQKLEKLEKKVQKGQEENDALKQEIDRLKQGSPLDDASTHPHAVAFMQLTVAFKVLAEEAEALTEEEKQQLAPRTFETIAAQMDKLSVAYNRTSGGKQTRKKKNELPDVLPSISDEQLAELMD